MDEQIEGLGHALDNSNCYQFTMILALVYIAAYIGWSETRQPPERRQGTMNTKIATVVITEDARTDNNALRAGTYQVEMPDDYDPEMVTGVDILSDDAIRIVSVGPLPGRRADYTP